MTSSPSNAHPPGPQGPPGPEGSIEPVGKDAQRVAHRSRYGLLLLLLLIAGMHAFMIAREPVPVLFEDEPHYAQTAFNDAARGDTSLLPGSLRFAQRPEFGSRLLSQFVRETDLADLRRPELPESLGLSARMKRFKYRDRGALLERRVRWLNLALFLGLLALTYKQARLLGMGSSAALLATALLGSFPWFGFYVHSLWAEIPHAFLLGVAMLGVTKHLQCGKLLPLVPAGLALGVALLAKGTLNSFLPLLALLLVLWNLWLHRDRSAWRRAGLTLLPCVLLFACLFSMVGPQLKANLDAGHGLRLAGNRWKNIEMGLLLEPRQSQDRQGMLERNRVHNSYLKAAKTYEEREALAQQRARAYVAEVGLGTLLSEQARKLGLILFSTPSFFERALLERWGPAPPAWLQRLRVPARYQWYLMLGCGLLGALLCFRRSAGYLLLALFVAYALAGALLIPYKVRFLMPVVPALCIFSAAALERLGGRLRAVRSPARLDAPAAT